ncbi:MAG: DegT/DnrJ/EryC1/StrS family aminotransferase, partial [Candidatus Hodarchaeota archaeon]
MQEAAITALLHEHFVLGESVYKFEEEFAKYCGVKYAVSTNSGTAALHLALVALGVDRGHRVVTSPASFIATANAVVHAGATPVFADIELQTYNLDSKQLRPKITPKTKAVISVHLYGYPSEMSDIVEVAGRHGLSVIEDACQAHGAVYKGRRVGSLGDIACFSFYSSKNLTVAGDGGMLVTDDKEIAAKVAKLRDCGRVSKYVHDIIGYTSRLNTVNAAVGRVQLKNLDEWNDRRRKNALLYARLLSDLDELVLPYSGGSEVEPVYHLYVIRLKHRDKLKKWLEENGIGCGIHYVLPIHLQPIYKQLYGFHGGEYPKSEELCRTCLSIPMHPHLTLDEIRYVSEKIHVFFRN